MHEIEPAIATAQLAAHAAVDQHDVAGLEFPAPEVHGGISRSNAGRQ